MKVGDVIQEKRPARGKLNFTLASSIGPGTAPFSYPKSSSSIKSSAKLEQVSSTKDDSRANSYSEYSAL